MLFEYFDIKVNFDSWLRKVYIWKAVYILEYRVNEVNTCMTKVRDLRGLGVYFVIIFNMFSLDCFHFVYQLYIVTLDIYWNLVRE